MGSGYSLVVFSDARAAPALLRAGSARPVTLLVRMSNGHLIEIALNPNEEAVEMTEAERDLLAPSNSGLVLQEGDLGALALDLVRWEHSVYPLGPS
jgi:hypothetical protein